MDTLVGTFIGGYTLAKLLGAGGMGSVYLATDPAVGQQVAVKVIRTDLDGYTNSAAVQLALERFRQEARAVAGLDHLHILPLYRYGEEETPQGPRSYMIMQYRPEGSLWDWLRRRADFAIGQLQPTQAEISSGLPMNWPLGLDEAAEYLQQAASALQYAHDRGIVHRDIKPANFLLRIDQHERSVHLLLSDFGLAKVFTNSSATNTILGTPTYMAPEQFEGAARPESDQYALAVMIYYLLAGRAPFEGDPMQLMRQHLVAPVPSITTFNPAISPVINGVLVRAMSKQPEQRFPSVAAFAEAFANVAKQPRPSMPGISSYPTSNGFAGANSQSGPLILRNPADMAMGMYNAPSPVPTAYPPQSPMPPMYATPSPNSQIGVGMYGAQASFADPTSAYAQPPSFAPTQRPMPGYQRSAGAYQDGEKVSRRGALGWLLGSAAVVAIGGGTATYFYIKSSDQSVTTPNGNQGSQALHVLKGHSAAVTSLNWLPNGAQLATGSLDRTVRLWSASNGSAGATFKAASEVNTVAWSADGSILASGQEDHSVHLWHPSGTLIRREAGWGAPIKTLAWRNDGNLLFFGTYGNGMHALQISNYRHYGKNSPLVRINSIAISPDGSSMALALASGVVYFADLANNWVQTATIRPEHGSALSIAWSSDGSLVAVGYADNYAIIYDAASKQVKYLLKHKGPVYSVAWKPISSEPVLASGSGDTTVNIWSLGAKPGQIIYSGHNDAVLSVAWSANLLASASKDQTAILWQPPDA